MKENEIRPAKVLELTRKKSNPVELKLTDTLASPVSGALPERHEPDGGEDGAHSLEKTDADEHWSDWEAEGEDEEDDHQEYQEQVAVLDRQSSFSEKKSERTSPAKVIKKPLIVSDLSALEIQVKSREDEIDYFADMEPTITSAPAVFAPVPASVPLTTKSDGLDFNVQSLEDEKDGDDGWNWDD